MELELKEKIAVVFGGSKGIGLAIAQQLFNEGAHVCIVSRSEKNLSSAKNLITQANQNKFLTYGGDLAEKDSIIGAKAFVKNAVGPPDIIINNSGGPPRGSFQDHEEKLWFDAFEQHLLSLVRLLKEFSDPMIEKKWGRFINISSTVALEPSAMMCLSAAMRAGVAALSKSASLSMAETGVTVNTICPGGVSTDRLLSLIRDQSSSTGKSFEKLLVEAAASIPMKRFAEPCEVANLAIFLCSTKADYITGRTHSVDGGLVKSL
jgi:3-oxoacyl-[acyl-carrier protein] reductase